MGNLSTVPPPSHVVRLSPAAWSLALSSASTAQSGHTDPSSAPAPDAGWAELNSLGLATGTELSSRWHTALQEFLSPAILLRLSAAYNSVGANSDLTLTADRGVCVHRRSTVETDNDGSIRARGHEPSLEVALFDAENIWGAISRVLPPLPELRADAVHARTDSGDTVVHMPLTPSEAAAVVPEEAILSAAMTTRAGQSRQVWAGRWSVSESTLYSVRTTDGALLLTPQRAGHVAREITFALAGAYEFVAGAAASA